MMKNDEDEKENSLEKIILEKPDIKNSNGESCNTCNDIDCKCTQIMTNLSECIELASQIGHNQLFNIFLTIYILLQQNPEIRDPNILKIIEVCQDVYKELNPKEMGQRLN